RLPVVVTIETETGIGGVRRFVSAAIADWRSCVSEPISLIGDASTNALIADGTTVWTFAVATGAYVSPVWNIGWPNASTLLPSMYDTVPVAAADISPRISCTEIEP